MEEVKRIERREDGDIAWDSDVVKLIDAKCKEFMESLFDTMVADYDLPDVEFIVHDSIYSAFIRKRMVKNVSYALKHPIERKKRDCCSRCDGCDKAEYREEEWYCTDCEAPCNEIGKCPWSV